MRIIGKALLFTAAALMLMPVSLGWAQTARDYLDLVKTRCEVVKQLVDKQRRSDLVARINKGRAYQTIIEQQNAFSLRLRNNKLTATNFERQTVAVQDGVNRFRTAYNNYDDTAEVLLAIDCKDKPEEFVNELTKARNLRAAIAGEVAAVETELTTYRQITLDFRQEVEGLNNSVSKSQL